MINEEEAHLENQTIHVTTRIINCDSKLIDLEEKILYILSNGIGDFVDVVKLVNALQEFTG